MRGREAGRLVSLLANASHFVSSWGAMMKVSSAVLGSAVMTPPSFICFTSINYLGNVAASQDRECHEGDPEWVPPLSGRMAGEAHDASC